MRDTRVSNVASSSSIASLVCIQIFIGLASAQIVKGTSEPVLSTDEGVDRTCTNQQIQHLESRLNELVASVAKLKLSSGGCDCKDTQRESVICALCSNSQAKKKSHVYNLQPPTEFLSAPITKRGTAKSQFSENNLTGPRRKRASSETNSRANLRGEPGRDGLDGVPGLDGAPGLDGVPGADGRNGKDGLDGRDGKDGRDGSPGERGPVGPPGPAGEPGKRGKGGPPGKQGVSGPPGVCAYRAKYDCEALGESLTKEAGSEKALLGALLVAPMMIGFEPGDSERQVTVNEGDNIQLSCEAFGLPKPSYIWRRPDKGSTILFDVGANLRISTYSSGQLPLTRVDRLQAGSYECLASNGILPNAVKRISLDVNYAPTVRIYPGPSVKQVSLGSSVLMECIVESNPSGFSYWMFGSESMMSLGTSASTSGVEMPLAGSRLRNSKSDKYIITESAGQLTTGAYFTILTLNITRVSQNDLGSYKCVSKNLVAQTTGYFMLIDSHASNSLNKQQLNPEIGQANKVRGSLEKRLDSTLGWPNNLIEREAPYVTFGNEHRQLHLNKAPSLSLSGFDYQGPQQSIDMPSQNLPASSYLAKPFIQTRPQIDSSTANATIATPSTQVSINAGLITKSTGFKGAVSKTNNLTIDNISKVLNTSDERNQNGDEKSQNESGKPTSASSDNNNTDKLDKSPPSKTPPSVLEGNGADNGSYDPAEESDLCHIEISQKDANANYIDINGHSNRSSIKLLDQVGKPVYVGNSYERGLPLNWWSLDSKLHSTGSKVDNSINNNHLVSSTTINDSGDRDAASNTRYYATSSNYTSLLFDYDTLEDLLKDKQSSLSSANEDNQPPQQSPESRGTLQIPLASVNGRRLHRLKYPLYGSSHVIYGGKFLYISHVNRSDTSSLQALHLIEYNAREFHDGSTGNNNDRLLKFDAKLTRQFKDQPFDLGLEYQLNRIELASDENGVWIIIPTIERKSSPVDQTNAIQHSTSPPAAKYPLFETNIIRRLHVIRLGESIHRLDDDIINIEYHVSMKLDWRMIGQMFIIDGVLYGIKDRHQYSSKLQFAYNLYRCKLLATEYLNEPHRTFTNHFGDTQLIKYNPNEPKRLYTVDSGNLLWCPVKLIDTNPDDI